MGKLLFFSIAVAFILATVCTEQSNASAIKYDYACVIDAGSSGSRIYVYKWQRRYQNEIAPVQVVGKRSFAQFDTEGLQFSLRAVSNKAKPGIDTLATNLAGIPAYMKPMIDYAIGKMPADAIASCPIFFGATAGMRLLSLADQTAILDAVKSYLGTTGFFVQSDFVEVITGQQEGIYGWLAVNFLNNTLEPTKTVATVDCGGASMQVSLVPQSGDDLNDVTVVDAAKYTFATYSHSYLGYGQDQAFLKASAYAIAQAPQGATVVPFPCFNVGYSEIQSGVNLTGTGSWEGCQNITSAILGLNSTDPSSSINNVWYPANSLSGMKWVTFSAFSYTPTFFGMTTYTPASIREAGKSYCALPWETVVAQNPTTAASFLKLYCMMPLYMSDTMTKAFHVSDTEVIAAPSTIGGVSVTWALGRAIYESAGPMFLFNYTYAWSPLNLTSCDNTCKVGSLCVRVDGVSVSKSFCSGVEPTLGCNSGEGACYKQGINFNTTGAFLLSEADLNASLGIAPYKPNAITAVTTNAATFWSPTVSHPSTFSFVVYTYLAESLRVVVNNPNKRATETDVTGSCTIGQPASWQTVTCTFDNTISSLASVSIGVSNTAMVLYDPALFSVTLADTSCVVGSSCCDTNGKLMAADSICRSAVSTCDVDEKCTGVSAECPNDVTRDGQVCRSAIGTCDTAEVCVGTVCPGDVVMPSTTVCQAPNSQCDPTSYCDGVHGTCPAVVPGSLCANCPTVTDPQICSSYSNCIYCGVGGCQNNTKKCAIPMCNGDIHYVSSWMVGFEHTPACGETNSSYFEVLAPLGAHVSINTLCPLLFVKSSLSDIKFTAVMYDATTKQLLKSQDVTVTPVTFPAIRVPITLATPWLSNVPVLVGIRWSAVCSSMGVILLTNNATWDKRDLSLYARDTFTAGEPFTSVPIPGSTGFFTMTSANFCGDHFTAGGEQCDGGQFCYSNCTCKFNLIPDGGTGCMCPTPLPDLHGHWFSAPPTFTTQIKKDDITVVVTLPQTNPLRFNGTAFFVRPLNGSSLKVPVEIPLINNGCAWEGSYTSKVSWLIRNTAPIITQTPTAWDVVFAMKVSWVEQVQLTKKQQTYFANRTMQAKLSFGLVIQRFVNVNSTITILDPRLLWAYVSKSYIVMDPVRPYMDLEITTHVKSGNLTVDPRTFHVLSHTGTLITDLTNLTLVRNETADGAMQRWSMRVFVDGSLCTTSLNDNFTLSYDLITAINGENLNRHTDYLILTLSQMENWCTVNKTISIHGSSQTYLDNALVKPANRFFPKDTVYMLVTLAPDVSIDLATTTVHKVELVGGAIAAGSKVIYNTNVSNLVTTDPNYAVTLFAVNPPTPCNNINNTCYSFYLPTTLRVNQPLTIYTTVRITLAGPNKRSVTFETATTVSRISILKSSDPVTPPDPVTPENTAVVVTYKVTPTFLAAVAVVVVLPIVSLITIVVLILRRRRSL